MNSTPVLRMEQRTPDIRPACSIAMFRMKEMVSEMARPALFSNLILILQAHDALEANITNNTIETHN